MHTQTLEIRLLENSLEFRPRKWAGRLLGAGCYPYAANFFCDRFIQIGGIIGKPCNMLTPDDELILVLQEELLYMGYQSVKEVQTDYKVQPGELKIYLQRMANLGRYHMFRQNDDGLWSHKFRNMLPTEKNYAQTPLYSPAQICEDEKFTYYGWCFLLKRD